MYTSPRTRLRAALARLHRYRAVVLALVAGTALSLALLLVTRAWERRASQARFDATARQQLELLRESLGNSLEVLYSLGALHRTGRIVDRAAFRSFTEPAFERHPELQALSWSPRVPAAQREAVEQAVRAEGFPEFAFVEYDPVTRRVGPARWRQDYYCPVIFVEPMERNRPAFGSSTNLDTGKVAQARDEGRATATSLIPLRQEENQAPGFVVYLPLYTSVRVPETLAERRAAFAGHTAAVFRIADLVQATLAKLPGMRVHISDPFPELRSVSYTPPTADGSRRAPELGPCTLQLQVADRELLVAFTPTTSFPGRNDAWQSWAMLGAGLLITVLTSSYLFNATRRGQQLARTNAALQAEVAERKHAEEKAAAANRAKSDFVSSLSHEIRTPLNTILGYAQILGRDRGLATEHRETLEAITNSGRHLLGLLDSILDLSRIEAGRVELQRDAFDLRALVEELATMFKPRCATKPLTLRLECRIPAGRGTVLGDAGKLRQVLINLVNNAIKFTPRGAVTILVQAAEDGADRWRFEVADTGIGIAPGERANMFTRFHQTAAGRRLGGTGLGLAIARGHVELMGGRLEVQSERGAGTRFFFSLPLAAAVLATPARTAELPPRLAPGVRLRALVVDDDRDNRHILARWLRDIGCAIAEAGTARHARDLAREAPPDILFLDVFLADTTGPELLAALRADGLPSTTPVLLHTAALLSREQRETLQATGADLLQKPFRFEDLCACLRRVPGVEFAEAPPARAAAAVPDAAAVHVPADLRDRLNVAAEMHSTTVLKACLLEMRQLGGPAAALAEHLRQLLRAYDLASITEHLRRLPEAGAPAPAFATAAEVST